MSKRSHRGHKEAAPQTPAAVAPAHTADGADKTSSALPLLLLAFVLPLLLLIVAQLLMGNG